MFITFEGTEGSGKTTQIKHVMAYLNTTKHNVLLTREPGGTLLGDKIRALLLENNASAPNPRAELLLFNASRAQLADTVIRPHLQAGGVVICDRYIDSTIAYQGYGHGLDLQYVKQTVLFATNYLMPDVTFYLDLPPEVGLGRRAAASLVGEEFNRLDGMEMEFHRRTYQGYQEIGKENQQRWLSIDANRSEAEVTKDIIAHLKARLDAN